MSKSIAEINDKLRQNLTGCRIILTQAVAHSPDLVAIFETVRTFNDFSADNDPHGEHDFAFFTVNGERYFFKFDYYDSSYMYFEENGRRVLTIGVADDY